MLFGLMMLEKASDYHEGLFLDLPEILTILECELRQAVEAAAGGKTYFTLIQGPPGTGKTATLLSLILGLVTRTYYPRIAVPRIF